MSKCDVFTLNRVFSIYGFNIKNNLKYYYTIILHR